MVLTSFASSPLLREVSVTLSLAPTQKAKLWVLHTTLYTLRTLLGGASCASSPHKARPQGPQGS